jgi:hypothetical protein
MTSSARSSHPSMSVIMLTPDRCHTLRHTLRHLGRQTIASELEIVIVVPSKAALDLDEHAVAPFHAYRVVEADSKHSSSAARVAGVLAATAPVVAFCEDHSFPTPTWAEALVARHREPWAAVGPALLNGNPQTLRSWTNLLIEYGPWLDPVPSGPRDQIPPHNSTYKRDILLAYGERLQGLIEAETVLHWDLRARGHQLYLESAAKTRHFNMSLWSVFVPLRFSVGRLFAQARARDWPAGRRILFTLASPLIPFVRFARTLAVVRRCGPQHRLFPRLLPLLFLGFVIDGCGEMVGYAAGGGGAVRRTSEFEFHRDRRLRPSERRLFAES